ncbi:MAG: metal-dependent hydrolase [Oligoflexia bacterium]|nr:metal-dependent hydrolase [Oligoflexia bacterium]
MLFFGHIGFAAAVSEIINNKFTKKRIKYHYFIVALMATFVDILDKPLAVYFFPQYHSGRIFFHTLIANSILLLFAYIFFSKYWHYWILLLTHLILDFIYDSKFIVNLFYPFLGPFPIGHPESGFNGMFDYVTTIIYRIHPIGIAFEILGFIILCFLLYRDRSFSFYRDT